MGARRHLREEVDLDAGVIACRHVERENGRRRRRIIRRDLGDVLRANREAAKLGDPLAVSLNDGLAVRAVLCAGWRSRLNARERSPVDEARIRARREGWRLWPSMPVVAPRSPCCASLMTPTEIVASSLVTIDVLSTLLSPRSLSSQFTAAPFRRGTRSRSRWPMTSPSCHSDHRASGRRSRRSRPDRAL